MGCLKPLKVYFPYRRENKDTGSLFFWTFVFNIKGIQRITFQGYYVPFFKWEPGLSLLSGSPAAFKKSSKMRVHFNRVFFKY